MPLTDEKVTELLNNQRRKGMKRGDLASLIFDLLAEHLEGLTMPEIIEAVHMPYESCRVAMRDLRLTLGEDDTLFVIAEPQGPREPWLYRLIDGSVLVGGEESGWAANRIGDAQSRIHLLAVAMSTAERATDGRTLNGRKARMMAMELRHLDEKLTRLDEDERGD